MDEEIILICEERIWVSRKADHVCVDAGLVADRYDPDPNLAESICVPDPDAECLPDETACVDGSSQDVRTSNAGAWEHPD